MASKAAQELGRLGGLVTASRRSRYRRAQIGRHGAEVRWAKDTTPPCPVCGKRHRLASRRALCAKIRGA